VAALVAIVLLMGPTAATPRRLAEETHDWPMFGGSPSRNLVNRVEKGMPVSWSVKPGEEKNVKWVAELGSRAFGGPVISDGKVFIGTNNGHPRDPENQGDRGILMCFEEATGKFLWQAVHDKLEAGRVNDWPEIGIASMPAVERGRLYYVSSRAEVICADTEGMANGNQGVQDEKYTGPNDADIIWRLDMIKELSVFPHNLAVCSPLLVGDRLYVVTANGVDDGHINIPSPEAPSFLAIDKKTGKVLWKDNAPSAALVGMVAAGGGQKARKAAIRKLVNQGKLLMHGQWSNPVYAEANGKPLVIFPGGDGWLRAFDARTNELVWKFDGNPKGAVFLLGAQGTRSDFIATPVVWENKLYIGVGQDPEHEKSVGHLWCIDVTRTPRNKDKDLTPVNNNFDPRADVNRDSGLVWHYGGPAPEGAERDYLFGRTMSTCAVHDGLCYVADLDGMFFCFDARTGKKLWDHDLEADTWGSPCWVDGKVYIGNDEGAVYVFAHGREKEVLGQVDMGEKIRGMPVVANGVLYIVTDNPGRLYAIAQR
jgi:outer membrane protein assembly factor BamB